MVVKANRPDDERDPFPAARELRHGTPPPRLRIAIVFRSGCAHIARQAHTGAEGAFVGERAAQAGLRWKP